MASDEHRDQDEAEQARRSRQTGGDAPAAGSVEEREEVAAGDGVFSGQEGSQAPAEQATDAEDADDGAGASTSSLEDDDAEEPRHGGYR